jgi:hypothetical protein
MLVVLKDKKDQEFTVAVSLHGDETVQFYYKLYEVNRSKIDVHGRVTNITINEDGFCLKVFEKEVAEDKAP